MSDRLSEIIAARKAPLVEADINELGDKRLSPEEGVFREREALLARCAHNKIGGQTELEDPERSGGPRLQYTELVSRLRRCIPGLMAVDGAPGSVALYYPRNREEYNEARSEWEWGRDEFFLTNKYVGGFPKQEIAEFSHVLIDSSHLPTREVRGWRSVLISLLKQGVVSYRTLVKEFGEANGKRAWRWQEQTRRWRNEPDTRFFASSLDPHASTGWGNTARS